MCSCNLVFCRPPQNRCTVATCACQVSPDKAQYVLCLVWMSEWCLLIGLLFTLGFIFRAFLLSQSTYDLQGRNWDHKYPWEFCGPFSASITNKIKKCLRQICLLSGYFGRGNVRWWWWTGRDARDWFVTLDVWRILTFLPNSESFGFWDFWDVWYFSCALNAWWLLNLSLYLFLHEW